MRKIGAAISAAVIGLMTVLSATGGASAAPRHQQQQPAWMTRACRTEDSSNCYWDARIHGNGRGESFYVREFAHATCWMFVRPVTARHWDHCEKGHPRPVPGS